jgi:hypothetical protein
MDRQPANNLSKQRPHQSRQEARRAHLAHCQAIMRRLRQIVHHKRQGLVSVDIRRDDLATIRRVDA